jgi:hypothetical protein
MIKLDAAQMAINMLANRCDDALVGEGTMASDAVTQGIPTVTVLHQPRQILFGTTKPLESTVAW